MSTLAGRIPTHGDMGDARNGRAILKGPQGAALRVMFSDGQGWDHVSVSLPTRCPTWAEMSFVKDTFFEPEDAVFQLHPPHSDYVNVHQFCLHLWRNQTEAMTLPPSIMVG